MIVVCRNAKERFDKPHGKWLWQNRILKFNFAQPLITMDMNNFQKNVSTNHNHYNEKKV